MTQKERNRIRIAAYILQGIGEAMHGRDIKTATKVYIGSIQKEGFIPALELIEKEDLLRIDIPDMFFLEFDLNRKNITIQLAEEEEVMRSLPESDVRSMKTAHYERLLDKYNEELNVLVNKIRDVAELRLQEKYKNKTYQIVDNRAIKSEIYIDRPRGSDVNYMLITNADTKRPIRYKISGDNIFLED